MDRASSFSHSPSAKAACRSRMRGAGAGPRPLRRELRELPELRELRALFFLFAFGIWGNDDGGSAGRVSLKTPPRSFTSTRSGLKAPSLAIGDRAPRVAAPME